MVFHGFSRFYFLSATATIVAAGLHPTGSNLRGLSEMCADYNPCQDGNSEGLFFPHENTAMYKTCGAGGVCYEMYCPAEQVWDQDVPGCVLGYSAEGGNRDYPDPNLSEKCADYNPCQDGNAEGLFFPHENPAMYKTCGAGGVCYEMYCPAGQVWDQDVPGCVLGYSAEGGNGGYPDQICDVDGCGNPCAGGDEYFYEHCYSDKKFIQCDDHGGCGHAVDCPEGTVWNQGIPGCVHDCDSETDGCGDPCGYGEYYHEHCFDEKKFIQCDDHDGCFVMDCAPGTIWSQDAMTCVNDCSNTLEMYGCANPCTSGNIEQNGLLHEFCADRALYVKCDYVGGCFVTPCGEDQIWDPQDRICIHDPNKAIVKPDSGGVVITCKNNRIYSHEFGGCVKPCDMPYGLESPCTKENVDNGYLVHEHWDNDKKFIMCDYGGGCSVERCPEGSKWVQARENCVNEEYDCGEGNRVEGRSGKGKGGKGKGGKGSRKLNHDDYEDEDEDDTRRFMKGTKHSNRSGGRDWHKGCEVNRSRSGGKGGKGKGSSSRSGKGKGGKGKGGNSSIDRRR